MSLLRSFRLSFFYEARATVERRRVIALVPIHIIRAPGLELNDVPVVRVHLVPVHVPLEGAVADDAVPRDAEEGGGGGGRRAGAGGEEDCGGEEKEQAREGGRKRGRERGRGRGREVNEKRGRG